MIRLRRNQNNYWITHLLIMGLTAASLAGCQSEQNWHSKSIAGLMPELAFTLENSTEEPTSETDISGKVNLLFFGFTNCPDICPTTLARFSSAVNALPDKLQESVQIVFISVDPERDRGQRLAEYTAAFSDSIIGLTGTQEQLQTLTRRYRVTYGYDTPDSYGNYNVSHSSAVFAFDSKGNVQLLMRDDLSVAQIADDLKQLIAL